MNWSVQSLALACLFGVWLAPRAACGAPAVVVIGASPDGFRFRSSDPKFSHRFQIVAANAEVVGPIAYVLPKLQDAAGGDWLTQSRWATGKPPESVTMTNSAELLVEATLPDLGEYATELLLVFGDTRIAYRVVVTRVAAAVSAVQELQVDLVGSTMVQLESAPWESEAMLHLLLRETSGTARLLPRPELSFLDLKGAGTDSFQSPGQLQVLVLDGSGVQDTISLAPNRLHRLDLTLASVLSAGTYQGSLRIRPDQDRKAVDVPFTVQVRRPWWLAAGFILLGVVVSTWLRWYLTKGRDQALWQRDLDELQARVASLEGASLGEEESRVLEKCRTELAELRAKLEDARSPLTQAPDFAPGIANLSNKLGLLGSLRALYRQVQAIPPSARAALRATLDEQAEKLIAAIKPEELSAVNQALAQVKVRGAQRAALIETLQRTTQLLDASGASLGNAEGPAVLEARAALRAVQTQLDQDQLPEAQAELSKVRGRVAGVLALGLKSELAGAAPESVGEARWLEIRADVGRLLDSVVELVEADPEAAVDGYARALALYATLSMSAAIETVRDNMVRVANSELEHKAELSQELAKLMQELAASEHASPSEALAMLRRTDRALRDLKPRMSDEAVRAKVAAVTATERAPGAWAVPEPAVIARASAVMDTMRSPRRPVAETDRDATLILLVIALASGLKALWLGDAVWGSLGDYLTAVLWGLGLHSVGNVAFEGLGGLWTKFSKWTS
ncbi:MAG: hypothetical protein WDO69_31115 [Pseudomonadota bacterium]